jgi:hypothetical protein
MANVQGVTIKDAEKAKLQAFVQDGDRNLDPKQAVAWAKDGSFQIGEFPPANGPDQIFGFLKQFFDQALFTTLEHELTHVLELPDEVSFQANAHYTLHNGERLTVPYANFITYTREAGALKFKTYRVYINAEVVVKRAMEVRAAAAR